MQKGDKVRAKRDLPYMGGQVPEDKIERGELVTISRFDKPEYREGEACRVFLEEHADRYGPWPLEDFMPDGEKLYDVHIYAIVRVKRTGVPAESPEEAIKKAERMTNLDGMFNNHRDGDLATEYADDIDCFLVDEENDPEYEKSTWYDKHGKELIGGRG